MRNMCTILLLMLVIVGLSAQTENTEIITSPPRLQCKAGFVDIDLKDFNRALALGGFHTMDNICHNEFSLIFKRPERKWGGTFSYTVLRECDDDILTTVPDTSLYRSRKLNGFGFKISNDYYLVNRKALKLYIPFGLHWTKFKLATFENIPFGFQFNNAAGVIHNTYTSWRVSGELGLNFEAGLPLGQLMLIIGVNTGYRIDFNDKPWKYEDEIEIGFPKLQNAGWVFGISFGISAVPRVYNRPRNM